MGECAHCRGEVEASFRFCPWCAAPQRSKLVEFFRPHPEVERDLGKALRVSRYFGPRESERHVRFSVWNEDGTAEAAVSLDDAEARRLARFLGRGLQPPPREGLKEQLYREARRARAFLGRTG